MHHARSGYLSEVPAAGPPARRLDGQEGEMPALRRAVPGRRERAAVAGAFPAGGRGRRGRDEEDDDGGDYGGVSVRRARPRTNLQRVLLGLTLVMWGTVVLVVMRIVASIGNVFCVEVGGLPALGYNGVLTGGLLLAH